MSSNITLAGAVCAGLALSFAISTTAVAASLSGQVGDKRRPMVIPPGAKGTCGQVYKDYIAAAGHSAYASTRIGGEYFFCGRRLNAPSQKAAEAGALDNCNAAKKKYKLRAIGPCEIVASK